jgi:hypothetical protein
MAGAQLHRRLAGLAVERVDGRTAARDTGDRHGTGLAETGSEPIFLDIPSAFSIASYRVATTR